ncbi:MAG: cytochrome d ubiquinol oxidase subunit II [Ectothiorhodospiraceae bacterium]|nr:cytochrome d ubiquinol oxidase subunit II [Ectothiorhodospiraceae bacterium]
MDLNIVWFLLIAVLFTGYIILDGFDFGVGILSLFAKSQDERRIYINAIGPVWDGNEVWLLTGGGALFAAFPFVYATVFSGFYLAIMLLLLALIARAVSMEFRGKVEGDGWRKVWDLCFGIGSLLPAVLFGVAFGNILRGLPLSENFVFEGNFLGLLNPYAILVGLLSLAAFTMHGAAYMMLKSDGELYSRMQGWVNKGWIATVLLYVIATIASILTSPFLFEGITGNPLFWLMLILLIGSLFYTPFAAKAGKAGMTFLSTSVMLASMLGIAAVSLFPMLVPSTIDLGLSMDIYNSSSTERTLWTMFIIALIGMPLVIGYTIFIYRIFKGKVEITPESY